VTSSAELDRAVPTIPESLIETDLVAISDALAALAKRYRDTPMAGRSNLQQAVPITFGYKVATYLAGFERHPQRLKELRPRVLVGELGNVGGSPTPGNHTAETGLAGCPRRIRTSLCRFRTDLLASFSRRSEMSGEEVQAPPDIRFLSKCGI